MEAFIKNLPAKKLAAMIDHTFLKAYGTEADIEKLCSEARKYEFGVVMVNPAEIATCIKLLKGSMVKVGSVISFPLGQATSECKMFEIRDAIEKGTQEIDMVINIRALQSGNTDTVKREIEDMVSVCNPAGVVCKVILETCYLTDTEKETVCRISRIAGADFVKTSTGFGTAGATIHDVELMCREAGSGMGVKASGGIKDLDTMLAMIKAGATRIGTSSGVEIMEVYLKMTRD